MKPAQGDDPEHAGRRRRQDRALMRTLGAGTGLQVATIVGALLSLPFVTRALTTAEYGVLATVTGFVVLLGFADLGVGSALTTRLAEAEGSDHKTRVDELVSSALAAVFGAAGLVLAVGVPATFLLPWQRLLGAEEIAESALRACILVLVGSTALTIVGSLGKSALYGIQRGSAANHWLVAATLAGAGCSILVALFGAPLWVFAMATVGAPAAVSLACAWWALRYTELRVRPRREWVSRTELRSLAGTGGWFFAIALGGALGYQTDSVVVASILGASAAGVYNVALRVLGLVTQSVYPALMQLWPAFTEALGRSDLHWIRSRFWWWSALAGSAAAVVSTGLVIFGPYLIGIWLTEDLAPPRALLAAFGVWTTYTIALAPLFFLLNAIGRVRAHALMAIATALANVPLSILLTHVIGISGPIFASLLASTICAALPAALAVRPVLSGAILLSGSPVGPVAATPQQMTVPESDVEHVHEP